MRVRAGVWDSNATPTVMEDQHARHILLARLYETERVSIAQTLEQSCIKVPDTLVALYEAQVAPREAGYEWSPSMTS